MNLQIDPSKVELAHGNHQSRDNGVCAMELVAWMAGEPHSDAPKCASPVIRRFVIRLNDRWGNRDRQRLKPYLARIIGTAGTVEQERRRAWLCADWAVRNAAPIALDAAGASNWADLLRKLPELVDADTGAQGEYFARSAQHAAYAAYDAADAAAYAAADAAADADAAAYAADAADAAAYAAAAYAAADAAAKWTEELKASSLDLLDRLIRATEVSR